MKQHACAREVLSYGAYQRSKKLKDWKPTKIEGEKERDAYGIKLRKSVLFSPTQLALRPTDIWRASYALAAHRPVKMEEERKTKLKETCAIGAAVRLAAQTDLHPAAQPAE